MTRPNQGTWNYGHCQRVKALSPLFACQMLDSGGCPVSSDRVRRAGLILVTALAACSAAETVTPRHPFFAGRVRPLVIAHRGGAGLWPENTLEAFRGALTLGVDVLEIDVQSSADGAFVVLHDATVDRTTDGRGRADARTLAELQTLDAGQDWSPDGGGTFPYRGRGLRIPTLDGVLTALPAATLLIEIKASATGRVRDLCRLLSAPDRSSRVLVASFDSAAIVRFRRACPAIATGATPREVARFVAARALRVVPLPELPAAAMQLPERYRGVPVLTPRVLAAAHARNVPVHAWVFNDDEDLRRLLAMGVDGIVTDRPDRLLAILGRR
jgi:glycerophosphoryl diester phosphodiesterase